MIKEPPKNIISKKQLYISDIHVMLANMPMEFTSLGRILLFPFIEVFIEEYYGEAYSPGISPFIRSYKAKLYTEIPSELMTEKVHDTQTRLYSELLIHPILEIYLLAHSLFYEEPIIISFENTLPKNEKEKVPSDIIPLVIDTIPPELLQLSADKEFIFDGRTTSQPQLLNRGLKDKEDLGNKRFTLVKKSGYGTILHTLHPQELNFIVFANLQSLIKEIRNNSVNFAIIKSLDFMRRALTLEKMGFYNEAYLNYFRIIEAFANSFKEKQLSEYFQAVFSLTEEEAEMLNRARNRVVAHGNQTPGYLREVGQIELYKIKDCAFFVLNIHLS